MAAIDVLGVSALTDRDEGEAVGRLATFVRNASVPFGYREPSLASAPTVALYQDVEAFGDSVYLFADPSLNLERQLIGLVVRVATLISLGLFLPPHRRVLLRAAVGVGDLRIETVEVAGASRKVRMGSAMVRAHALEEAQDWIGAAVDGLAPVTGELVDWVVLPYPVPQGTRAKMPEGPPPRALNWLAKGRDLEAYEQALQEAVADIGVTPSAERKQQNTIRFMRWVFAQGVRAPFEFAGSLAVPPEGQAT